MTQRPVTPSTHQRYHSWTAIKGDVDETPQTLLEHLSELRSRLIRSIAVLGIGIIASALFTGKILEYLKTLRRTASNPRPDRKRGDLFPRRAAGRSYSGDSLYYATIVLVCGSRPDPKGKALDLSGAARDDQLVFDRCGFRVVYYGTGSIRFSA
jgi:hypothetical protein